MPCSTASPLEFPASLEWQPRLLYLQGRDVALGLAAESLQAVEHVVDVLLASFHGSFDKPKLLLMTPHNDTHDSVCRHFIGGQVRVACSAVCPASVRRRLRCDSSSSRRSSSSCTHCWFARCSRRILSSSWCWAGLAAKPYRLAGALERPWSQDEAAAPRCLTHRRQRARCGRDYRRPAG